MCRVMNVHPSGYYVWRTSPTTARQREDVRLLGLIKQFWLESGGVYGYRKVIDDMRDMGERCSRHRVYRLMQAEVLQSKTGYSRRPSNRYSRPSTVVPNHVEQQFKVTEPNKIDIANINYSNNM
jgi:putative transposase